MKITNLTASTALSAILLTGCSFGADEPQQISVDDLILGPPVEELEASTPDQVPAFPEQTRAPSVVTGVAIDVETVAEGLAEMWGMAILPDGRLLVTERDGQW